MKTAPKIVLSDEERDTLGQWVRSRTIPARQVQRAQIVPHEPETGRVSVAPPVASDFHDIPPWLMDALKTKWAEVDVCFFGC